MIVASVFIHLIVLGGVRASFDQLDAVLGLQHKSDGFDVEPLHGEFIVSYDGYYVPSLRYELLHDAQKQAGDLDWTIVPKRPELALKPSDFDVIRLTRGAPDHARSYLSGIAHVRSVHEQHRIVPRSALAVDEAEQQSRAKGDVRWKHKLTSTGLNHNNTVYQSRETKRAKVVPKQISTVMGAQTLWDEGVTGKGVKVAVFDTGLPHGHPHFKSVKLRMDFTNEESEQDGLGHGTFVAGVIAGITPDCLGLAPDADLYIYRVFTNDQVSYTSWFLDAFNHAIMERIDVLNLSIGGPDFMDQPFVDKVWELTANNIIMVSAIGNDGPLYGTLNNPADQMDVIGVGGINYDDQVASFSSRGMTTWELPGGYGRLKPDIVTYGQHVYGASARGGCRTLSGTSVSAPVVTGAITLLASAIPDRSLLNPAMMKQALMVTARRVEHANMFEQGHGKVDLVGAYEYVKTYKPIASLSPSYIDLTECPYMWPYCSQPLYYTAQPVLINVTILNGMAVSGRIIDTPRWHPSAGENGRLLRVNITYRSEFWPWSSYLGVALSVAPKGRYSNAIAAGFISLTVQSSNELVLGPIRPPTVQQTNHDLGLQTTQLLLPVRVKIVPQPARSKRLLWDQFHNMRYPPGYYPRDNLRMKDDPLDWNADHVHTNFKALYENLRQSGYFVEVLGQPWTCFEAKNYASLLLVDPECDYSDAEVKKISTDVNEHGLSLMVFADWYNTSVMQHIRFFDENTKRWWYPETGGANLPALNRVLSTWEIGLSDRIFEGDFKLGDHTVSYFSGSSLTNFPATGLVYTASLSDQAEDVLNKRSPTIPHVPVLGVHIIANAADSPNNEEVGDQEELREGHTAPRAFNKHPVKDLATSDPTNSGMVVVFGDSNCLDSAHLTSDPCFWLIDDLLRQHENPSASFAQKYGLVSWSDVHHTVPKQVSATPFSIPPPPAHDDLCHSSMLTWAIPSPLDQTGESSVDSHLRNLMSNRPQPMHWLQQRPQLNSDEDFIEINEDATQVVRAPPWLRQFVLRLVWPLVMPLYRDLPAFMFYMPVVLLLWAGRRFFRRRSRRVFRLLMPA